MRKKLKPATSTYSLKTPAATPDAADQVQSFIASGVDAIIVDPVDSASTPQLTKMAQQAKMPLVYVEPDAGDKTLPPGVVFVGSDERESGTLQMEALAKLANYKGNVAIMIGNSPTPARCSAPKMWSRWWPSIRQ